MTFNFSKTNMSLETINKYLESQGIELTSDEKKQINTIFQESDTWNAGKRSEGKDGILNSIEASTFSLKINNALPKLKAKIDSLIENLGLKFEAPEREIEAAPRDNTRVENVEREVNENVENHNKKIKKGDLYTRFVSKLSANSSITLNESPVFDKEVFTQALNSLVKDNSKMKNMGGAFIGSSIKDLFNKPLNPFIVVAIAMHESARGSSKAALQKNNIGGIMGKNGLRKFEKVEQCIDSITSTVNKRVTEGYTSIRKVGNSGRYCKKSVGAHWSAQVANFAEKLRAKYEELLKQKYDIK